MIGLVVKAMDRRWTAWRAAGRTGSREGPERGQGPPKRQSGPDSLGSLAARGLRGAAGEVAQRWPGAARCRPCTAGNDGRKRPPSPNCGGTQRAQRRKMERAKHQAAQIDSGWGGAHEGAGDPCSGGGGTDYEFGVCGPNLENLSLKAPPSTQPAIRRRQRCWQQAHCIRALLPTRSPPPTSPPRLSSPSFWSRPATSP